jgi:predicted GNAT superfamily acetyltransferase
MTQSNTRSKPVLTGAPAIELRALKTHADYAACVQLQRETWGMDYADCVPASVLKVSQLVGGVSGGAFSADGRLVGFVYGLTGVREGRMIHWSHMLAVAADYRNHGVGRRLKEYQREVLRGHGVEMMYWTFDPLVARNAHLNINRLGTRVQEYVPDMYGATGSDLHAFGTDRFVVSWPVSGEAHEASAGGRVPAGGTVEGGLVGAEAADTDVLRIEIPADVETMAVTEAQGWREATRPAFVRLLGEGYRVTGFVGDPAGACFYQLSRGNGGAGPG